MENYECISIDSMDTLRAALATGDVSIHEIEHTLQNRMDEELNKPAHEVDGDLVERIEKMLQIPDAARRNGQARIEPWSFDTLMGIVQNGCDEMKE